jgi:hypothetical protein
MASFADHDDGLRLRSTIEHGEMTTQIPADFGLPGSDRFVEHPNQRDGGEDHNRIFRGMAKKQLKPIADVKVLKGTVYSFKNRRIITRWIRDVCAAFRHKTTTFNISVQLTDAFLYHNRKEFPVGQCQLVALGAIWIAAKFEELDRLVPTLRGLTDVCDRAYTADQIIDMEETLLEFCKYKVPHTTAISFVHLYLHAIPAIAAATANSSPRGSDASGVLGASANSTLASVGVSQLGAGLRDFVVLPDELRSSLGTNAGPAAPAGQIDLLLVNRDTHASVVRSVNSVAPTTKLSALTPHFAAALRVPAHVEVALYLVVDTPIRLGRPVGTLTYADAVALNAAAGLTGRAPLLYGRPTTVQNCVFAERSGWLLLRTPNDEVLRVAEAALREALINVEFLRVDSHVLGFAALAFAIALTSSSPEAAAATVLAVQRHVIGGYPMEHFRSGVQLVGEKYSEAVQQANEAPPAATRAGEAIAPLPLPANIQSRVDDMLAIIAPKAHTTTTVRRPPTP